MSFSIIFRLTLTDFLLLVRFIRKSWFLTRHSLKILGDSIPEFLILSLLTFSIICFEKYFMRILFTLCICMVLSTLQAQKLDHRLGYIILQIEDDKQLDDLAGDYASKFRSNVRIEKALSQRLGIYLMRFDHARIHEGVLLNELRQDSRVTIAQYDHITTNRNIPNDPQFIDQWHWFNSGQTGGLMNADTDVELAWDITQGGVTALGDTIVVAIIDDGLNYLHPDIAANTWINHGEIPNNGIDDDENGYKDDVYGWNVYSDSSDVLNQGHGLGVAGMIGAVGNNGIG